MRFGEERMITRSLVLAYGQDVVPAPAVTPDTTIDQPP
jgi:hypothetical protein